MQHTCVLNLLPSQGSDLLLSHHLHFSSDITCLGTGVPKCVVLEGMQYGGIRRLTYWTTKGCCRGRRVRLLNLSPRCNTLQGYHCKYRTLQLFIHRHRRQAYTPVKSVVAIIEKGFVLAHILQAYGASVKSAVLNINFRVTAGGHRACEKQNLKGQLPHQRRRVQSSRHLDVNHSNMRVIPA